MMKNQRVTDVMRVEREQMQVQLNASLLELAQNGHPLACFTYSKELYNNLRNGRFGFLEKSQQKELFALCEEYLTVAAQKGVSSAYFYLGMIYLEGVFVKQSPKKAIDYYIRGAAKNNAFCFFELSRLHKEGAYVEKDHYLEALYLRRSAEEGFVMA